MTIILFNDFFFTFSVVRVYLFLPYQHNMTLTSVVKSKSLDCTYGSTNARDLY